MSESDEKARRKRRETVQPLGASDGFVRERRREIDEDGDALKIQILGERDRAGDYGRRGGEGTFADSVIG